MPRHLRCPLTGTLCTRCATTKPISALNTTALTANTTDWRTTIQNVSRVKRKAKLPRPTKRSIPLFSIDMWMEYNAGYSTSRTTIRMSGSAITNAMVDFRPKTFRSVMRRSDAHEAFELRDRPVQYLLDGLAALRVLGDHLGRDRLRVDLHRDFRRRRERRHRKDLARLGRVVVERALWRAFLGPGLEVVQFRESRYVVTLARRDQLLDGRTLRKMQEQALGRGLVLGELPDAPEIRQIWFIASLWPARRREGPELLGHFRGIALGDCPGAGRIHDEGALAGDQRLVVRDRKSTRLNSS